MLTKLFIPPIRPGLIHRPRLIGKLNTGLKSKLILVSAPAGFGKTTLITTWLRQWSEGSTELSNEKQTAAGNPAGQPSTHYPRYGAWLSLDASDNQPAQFLTYFIRALERSGLKIGEAALPAIQSPPAAGYDQSLRPEMGPQTTALLNEIAEIPAHLVVVLDDYHVITNQQIHQTVTFLLDNLPPQMVLLISSRADPPWPLARLRAAGDMTELRAHDLRFTLKETTSFLNEITGLDLSPDQIRRLDSRTEGWITGLQMVALSMRQREDRLGFVNAFTGSHRFILDYLVEEVLDQQPAAIQAFLLKSSVLDHLSAPLCDMVMERDDSQTILAQLDQANLFLVPLDDERGWFRYHHLFGDLLRSRLNQAEPDLPRQLHLRASEWYEQNGLIAESVNHALAAVDIQRVAQLVEGNALAVMGHGELTSLVEKLDALPGLDNRSQPWLTIVQAWALAYSGRLDAAEPLLQEVERSASFTEGAAEFRRLKSRVTSLRAYVAELKGDVTTAVVYAQEALEQLPDGDLSMRGYVASLLGANLREGGQLLAAGQMLAEAASLSRAAGDVHVTVMVMCRLASLELVRGQYRKAAVTCQNALRLAGEYVRQSGRQLPVTGYAHLRMSQLLFEWNDLEAALRHAREGVRLSQRWGQADILGAGYLQLSNALQAGGDSHGALEAIQNLNHAWAELPPWFDATAAAHEMRIRLFQRDLAGADLVLRRSGLDAEDAFNFRDEFAYRTVAALLIAQGKQDEALALLARLESLTETAMAMGIVIKILVLKAIALYSSGQLDQALISLERALTLAEPEGCVRSFIDHGALMGQLLPHAGSRGIAPLYAKRLLSALGTDGQTGRQSPTTGSIPSPPLVEPLSRRELQVLRLLATSLSTAEIAEQLFVAPSTVRTHVKSIYGKLDVHRRVAAIQRARELGLLRT